MKAPDRTVVCTTPRGELRPFKAGSLRFRPAAYGIALREGQVLVARSRFSGRWELPGGAVAPWERLEEGLAREFEEETGIPAMVGPFVGFDQSFIAFFQYPFNSLRFFYRVEAGPGEPRPQADEVEEVRWVLLEELGEEAMAPGHHRHVRACLEGKGSRG